MSDLHCYCGTSEVNQLKMLCCRLCKKYFHVGCLKQGKPSPLEGDVLFDFACAACNQDGFERCSRLKLQWTHAVMLALYNLQLQGEEGKCGYFRWREHICNFIDKNWITFFGFGRKKTNTWHGTVAGTLSAGCPRFFTSGSSELKEPGWWSLTNSKPPLQQELLDQLANAGNRSGQKSNNGASRSAIIADGKTEAITKRADVEGANSAKSPEVSTTTSRSSSFSSSSVEQSTRGETAEDVFRQLAGTDFSDDDDLVINPGSISPVMPPSPSIENLLADACEQPVDVRLKREGESMRGEEGWESDDGSATSVAKKVKRQLDFDKDVSLDAHGREKCSEVAPRLVPLTIYEEKDLLRRIDKIVDSKVTVPEVTRLRRKLILRQQKRERNLPVFCLNSFLKSDDSKASALRQDPLQESFSTEFRILDRYQMGRGRSGDRQGGCSAVSFVTKLVGSEGIHADDIVSPYTTRVLKPFIWRDYESRPLKLRLLRDILARGCKQDVTPMAPIDYRYVRPQYIPAINSLCREFFWPGIDLTESLRYPDFSCVALYRKVVIGFAFMIPDVKYNEAYISFVFTHPEWRGAGIATFMLYHLIQTCMGKDVTLHVSATNPALLLYQKFGFKVEEFVVDFYDKYFPLESRECKHAMFLRLSR